MRPLSIRGPLPPVIASNLRAVIRRE